MRSFDGTQVMQDGMPLLPQLYTSSDMSDFHDILAQGANVVVRQVQHNILQIQWLATAIERELGCVVGVHAYLSFSRGKLRVQNSPYHAGLGDDDVRRDGRHCESRVDPQRDT
jgi:hypothetical protein